MGERRDAGGEGGSDRDVGREAMGEQARQFSGEGAKRGPVVMPEGGRLATAKDDGGDPHPSVDGQEVLECLPRRGVRRGFRRIPELDLVGIPRRGLSIFLHRGLG